MKTFLRFFRLASVGLVLMGAVHGRLAWPEVTEEVTWHNGDVELHGTLHLPDGEGPYPAFILLHGAGPEDRKAFTARRIVAQFPKHGVAMLHYDKRGAGESSGDWQTSNYEDLARDAVAGIELLAARDDIDTRNFGIIGISEGGWTGPLAATISGRVSMIVLVSAPPMPPLEQGFYEFTVELREEGATEAQIAEALTLERQRMRVLKTNEGWEELNQAIQAAKSKPWYKLAGSPEPPDRESVRWRHYVDIMDYDPMPVLHKLDIPALILYGEVDPLVDAKRSSEIMREVATKENKDFTIHVYPGCGHNLTTNGFTFPDGHFERIFDWIAEKRTK